MTWLSELSVAIPLAALCLLVSGFCSGTEVALFSLRRVDREQLARSESNIDQRIIDEWTGHQTEEMRKRYRHLFPHQQQTAIRLVFGDGIARDTASTQR